MFKQAILRRGLPARLYVDNGANYRSHQLALAFAKLGVALIHARPYQPAGNGKAERVIQSALCERACARTRLNSDQRARHLPDWLHRCSWRRPHGSLNANAPISGLPLNQDSPLILPAGPHVA